MAEDKEILKSVWDGKVPIAFTLAADEVLAPRCSYLTLVTDAVQRHFLNSIPEPPDTEDEIWFEFEGTPLKWHWPIGVLFDMYGHNASLPWNVTVHFQSYPDDYVLHCQDREVVESHVINALKEADCVRNGTAKRTLALLKKDLKQLWEGLRLGRFDQYWAVNRRLIAHDDPRTIKHIPFRLYAPREPVVTEPFAPFAEDGRMRTLGELLGEARPDLFPAGGKPRARVLVHGVCPALETPVIWLSDNCAHPDNFLHIVIHPRGDAVTITEEH